MMTKYLIFNNSLSTGKRNGPGTPEAVACEIARAVDKDAKGLYDYVAYSANKPEATLEVLKALPVYSINLTKQKITTMDLAVEYLHALIIAVEEKYSFNDFRS